MERLTALIPDNKIRIDGDKRDVKGLDKAYPDIHAIQVSNDTVVTEWKDNRPNTVENLVDQQDFIDELWNLWDNAEIITVYHTDTKDPLEIIKNDTIPDGYVDTEEPGKYDKWDSSNNEWVLDLELVDTDLIAQIDEKASEVRERFISSGTGQSAVYLNKYDEAKEYKAASSPTDSDYPYLNAESTRRGLTMSELADEVIATRNSWTNPADATIEAERVGGKQDIRNASTVADKEAAKDDALTALDAITP